ncbi:hypothetical protein [uncultured Clostridium sp.]|uniref:hypothetical protein n=1 Tax=uncultured Clostridium sp. TaxID=59620 RepID=UPI00263644D1|nr:hypothetical protein [uncultured Clostridium sp.]
MFKYIISLIVIITVVVIFRHRDIFVSKLSVKISLKGISIEIENKEKKRPS